MGRLSLHTDQKLLSCGMALARKKGLSGFSVRELCAKSKVNLGMFHYSTQVKRTYVQYFCKEKCAQAGFFAPALQVFP